MDFSTINGVTLPGNLQVTKMQHGNDVLWQSSGGEDYSLEPFFIQNDGSTDGTVTFKKYWSSAPSIEVYTSTDNETWTLLGTTSTTRTTTLPANGRLYIRATADRWATSGSSYNTISVNVQYDVCGNILSLLYGADYAQYTTLPNYTYTFNSIFEDQTNLLSAEHLIMPSNATANCYGYMFSGCTSLTTAPELPATTLESQCYISMFSGCTSLTYIKALFGGTTLATNALYYWIDGVTSSGTLELSGAFGGYLDTGVSGVPTNFVTKYDYLSISSFVQGSISNTVDAVPSQYVGVSLVYTVQPDGMSESEPMTIGVTSTGTTTIDYSEFYNPESGYATVKAHLVDGSGTVSPTYSIHVPLAEDYRYMPLFVQNRENSVGTVVFTGVSGAPEIDVYTSTDNINWSLLGTTSGTALTTTLPANGRVYIRATANQWGTSISYYNTISVSDVQFEIGGNILSLLYGADYRQYTELPNYASIFDAIFEENANLVSAEKLILLPSVMKERCYEYMFYNCTGLTSTPVLPATTLASDCYTGMFKLCTSLTQAPALPAETLAENCYLRMFQKCTSLTTAPELQAETLVTGCYNEMFDGCTSLNYIKALFLTTPITTYTNKWVQNVAATGTFVKSGWADWSVTGVNGVPTGWTIDDMGRSLPFYIENLTNSIGTVSFTKTTTNAPTVTVYVSTDNSTWTNLGSTSTTAKTTTLPANGRVYVRATVTSWGAAIASGGSVYHNSNKINASVDHKVGGNIMSLIYGSSFSSTTLSGHNYAFKCLFYNDSKLLDASDLILPATTLSMYCYYYMFYSTGLVNAPKYLPATALATYCYYAMFDLCRGLVNAPKYLPATTLATYCYANMFHYCQSLTTAPVLPATTLVNNCYHQMFYQNKNLNYIKAMFTTTPGTSYTSNWVYGVAATGTFVKNSSATWNVSGAHGIPSGWTVETASA